jgi:N-acetylglucosamine-6-sulfatase
VLILTDDQRWDTLWAMPYVQSDLIAPGIDFNNAFAVNPLCCPSRASILTGQFSHTHLVYQNGGDYGGLRAFDDQETIATSLQSAGYQTGLVGRYLSGYRNAYAGYIPPGWDRWFVVLQTKLDTETAYYYDYNVSDQGAVVAYGNAEADYSTDVFAAEAASFIRTANPDQPLFLFLATAAPHTPAMPPARYSEEFSDLEHHRPPSFNEADTSDKPAYVRDWPRLKASNKAAIDDLRIKQYRTLLAVDDAVESVVTALSDTGRLGSTMIVFASDNGFAWGEHKLRGKSVPYEESIRIPLVIRYDALIASPGSDDHLIANIDLAPTFAELAGASGGEYEGQSLLPLLSQPPGAWREDLLVEHTQGDGRVPTYCAVRSTDFAYVTYGTAEEELYDLAVDPYQLDNLAADPAHEATVGGLRTRLQESCSPSPPGFVFPYDALSPSAPIGVIAVASSPTEVDVSWTASTDNVSVTGYTIYRDGVEVATVDGATTSFHDTGLSPLTDYTYTVDAFDEAGNHSALSEPVMVSTFE